MKLLQLNAWAARLDKQIISLLEREKPDIVCLQEVIDTSSDAFFFSPFKSLSKDYPYSFHSPVCTFNLMQDVAHFGNGILSRLPFGATETIFTNLEYITNFSFEEHDYNIRNLQHAVVKSGDTELHILNHHGHHVPDHKNGNQETMRQCHQIADYVATLKGPVVLTGDFNLSPESESLAVINKQLRNLPVEHGLKTTRNQFTSKKEVCDYIFVNNDIKVKSFEMLEDLVSDHAALVLEFEV